MTGESSFKCSSGMPSTLSPTCLDLNPWQLNSEKASRHGGH